MATKTASDNCATKGCGHPRSVHDLAGRNCWGKDTTCPCTAYTASRDEARAVEEK